MASRGFYTSMGKNSFWKNLAKSYDIFNFGSDKYAEWEREALLDELSSVAPELLSNEYFQGLDEASQDALLDKYYKKSDKSWANLGGLLKNEEFDTERLLRDLNQFNALQEAMPDPVLADDYLGRDALANRTNELYAERTAELDALDASRKQRYDEEMSDIRSNYAQMRNSLLASQRRQESEILDTMSSDLSKSRRNALEAGASAGLRLADNINVMLSAQNKQAQTSLDTSNQLAQMMLNQQAASRQARDSYDSYMERSASQRNSARDAAYSQAYNEGSTGYNNAVNDYNTRMNAYENQTAGNTFANHAGQYYRDKNTTSKYQR